MVEPKLIVTSRTHKMPMRVGEVAKVCGLSKKTVINYIHKKSIPAHRTRGQHWRVWPGDLAQFIREHDINVPFSFAETRLQDVLIINRRGQSADMLSKIVRLMKPGARITATDDGHAAMFHMGSKAPQIIITNAAADLPLQTVLQTLTEHHKVRPTMLVISVQDSNYQRVSMLKEEFPRVSVHAIHESTINTNILPLLRRM